MMEHQQENDRGIGSGEAEMKGQPYSQATELPSHIRRVLPDQTRC